MILAGNYFPCYSMAKHAEMHLREFQGSVQHTLSVRALEGSTPRASFLPTSRTVRRIKKGGGNSPLFPKYPLEDVRPGPCEPVTPRLLWLTVSPPLAWAPQWARQIDPWIFQKRTALIRKLRLQVFAALWNNWTADTQGLIFFCFF